MAYDSEFENEAPFNFAIATLMRIDRDLNNIALLTLNHSGEAQHAKIDAVKNFFRNSVILIKKDLVRKDLLSKLNLLTAVTSNKVDSAGNVTGTIKVYSDELDKKIELFILEVQEALQESGSFFMPKKSESRLF